MRNPRGVDRNNSSKKQITRSVRCPGCGEPFKAQVTPGAVLKCPACSKVIKVADKKTSPKKAGRERVAREKPARERPERSERTERTRSRRAPKKSSFPMFAVALLLLAAAGAAYYFLMMPTEGGATPARGGYDNKLTDEVENKTPDKTETVDKKPINYVDKTERFDLYNKALSNAKDKDGSVFVLLHGSDWCVAGERFKKRVWDAPALGHYLSKDCKLVAVDHREAQADRELHERIGNLIEMATPAVISDITSRGGAKFITLKDGSVRAEGANPHSDVYTVSFSVKNRPAEALILTAMIDDRLPNGGPGRAGNGNYWLTEAEVFCRGSQVKLVAAYAPKHERNWSAVRAIDGNMDSDSSWSGAGNVNKHDLPLVLVPEKKIAAGTRVTLKLHFVSKHGQHSIGRMRVSHSDRESMAKLAGKWASLELKRQANMSCPAGTWNYPAIFAYDFEGREYASWQTLDLSITPDKLSLMMKDAHDKRVERFKFWDEAYEASGKKKAELLGRGLDTLSFDYARNKTYEPIRKSIKEADPSDTTLYTHKYSYNPHVAINEAIKLAEGGKHEEALAKLKSELKQLELPGHKTLPTEYIQQLHRGIYRVYRAWGNHKDEEAQALLAGATIDLNTNLGLGMAGLYNHWYGPPSLRFGWKNRHCSGNRTSWKFGDNTGANLAKQLTGDGKYELLLKHTNGKSALEVTGVELLAKGRVLAKLNETKRISGDNPEARYTFDIKGTPPSGPFEICMKTSTYDGTDSSGSISFGRVVEKKAAPVVAFNPPALPAAPKPLGLDIFAYIERGDFKTLQGELRTKLRADINKRAGSKTRILEASARDADVKTALAIHELIYACGTKRLQDISDTKEGKIFLKHLVAHRDWLREFLSSGPMRAGGGKSAELLGELFKHDPSMVNERLWRAVAVALALETADKNDSGIAIERYDYFKESHAIGRLHKSFDSHEAWELRFVVTFDGGRDDGSIRYLRDTYNVPLGRYYGACWLAPYLLHNTFGDSIHGRTYYVPWSGAMPWWKVVDVNGGVCGSLSHFGTMHAKVHGIAAAAMGEPGHCAHAIRPERNKWVPTYSLSEKRWVKQSFYSGSWMHVELMDEIWTDKAALKRASLHRWQAHLLMPLVDFEVKSYKSYEGNWRSVPDFTRLTPVKEGKADRVDFSVAHRRDQVGLYFEATLNLAQPTTVRLGITSDDGSKVWVNGNLLINNDGLHGAERKEGTLDLDAGAHDVIVSFFEAGGGEALSMDCNAVGTSDDVIAALELATKAHPLHFGIWREYLNILTNADLPQHKMAKVVERVSGALGAFPDPCDQLVRIVENQVLLNASASTRIETAVMYHKALANAKNPPISWRGWGFTGVIDRQMKNLSNKEKGQLFDELLDIHLKSKYFDGIVEWTNITAKKDVELGRELLGAMAALLKRNPASMQEGRKKALAIGCLKLATELKDFDSYANIAEASMNLPPEGNPNLPSYQPFSGKLLTERAIVQISTTSRWDRPLLYPRLLREKGHGAFHTDKENNPWAQVMFEKSHKLNGIYLANEHGNRGRAVPLHVSTSEDGKNWTEIFMSKDAHASWRIDLSGKNVRARYVKIEVKRGEGKTFLHLRKILIWGQ